MVREVKRLVEAAWPTVKEALEALVKRDDGKPPSFHDWTSWSCRISPGFPAVWPMGPGRVELHFHAYAAGLQPGVLMDGERFTPLWARVRVVLPGKAMKLEILNDACVNQRTQGVRPLRPEEMRIFDDQNVIEDFGKALAAGMLPAPLEKRVREYYLQWSGFHGVAKYIEALHPAFYQWLRVA
jgi:hypothetical protein